MVTKNCVIEFSLDYNLDCEDFSILDVNGNKIETTYERVRDYLKKVISENVNFVPSEHRTRGVIKLMNEFMSINYISYNRPDWDDYNNINLGIVNLVPFEY